MLRENGGQFRFYACSRLRHYLEKFVHTTYGLGADATSDAAVSAIYAAKDRPATNPLIIHVADMAQAEALLRMPQAARELADAFWPGALTIVAPYRQEAGISAIARAGLDTLAVRVPAHPLAQELLSAFGGPVAAPSANVSGRLSPTEAEHVAENPLAEHVACILDGGECAVGLESTIIGFDETGKASLLRPGGIAREEIERLLGQPLHRNSTGTSAERLSAPGQLSSHYAPRARLRLRSGSASASSGNYAPRARLRLRTGCRPCPCPTTTPRARGCGCSGLYSQTSSGHYAPRARLRLNAGAPRQGEMYLAFGPDAPQGVPGLNLSPSGDLAEAATNLYAYLHILDATGVEVIAVAPIPAQGLGEAINNRLRRAAAPRPRTDR